MIVFKEKLASAKNELKEFWQINEKLQQEVNELRTVNEKIFSQCRKCLSRFLSPAERTRRNTLNINISISTKKLTKHFDFKSFINRWESFKWKEWRQKIEIKIIVNVDHWNNEEIEINYVCFRISEEIVDYVYIRFNNFSNDLYEIW